MKHTFTPRMEILPAEQQRLWPMLAPARDLGFVLYGGTAIALRLGHRTSVDFDFFTDNPLDRAAIEAALPFVAQSLVLQDQANAFSLLVPGGADGKQHVKLSFFGTIAFGRIGEPDLTADGVMAVASLDDLMATKVKVILQRAEAKDYRDIAAMLDAGVSLAKGLATARLFFGNTFQPSESLKAMAYFSDGDLHTLTKVERATLVNAASKVQDLPLINLASNSLTS